MKGYRAKQGTQFNFNSDLSGDLIIRTETEPDKIEFCIPSENGTTHYRHWLMHVPAQDVKEFILSRLAQEAVSILENEAGLMEIIVKTAIRFLDGNGGLLQRLLSISPRPNKSETPESAMIEQLQNRVEEALDHIITDDAVALLDLQAALRWLADGCTKDRP